MPQLVIAAAPVVASALGVAGPELYAITAFSMVASYAVGRSQMPGTPDPQAITRNIKSPVAPRRIIYGKRRVGGTIVYASTTDDDNYLHMMIALAGHEVKSISDIYMNDKKLEEYDNAGTKQRVYVTWNGTGVSQDSFTVTINATDIYSGTIEEIRTALLTDGYYVGGIYQEYSNRAEDQLWKASLSIQPPNVDDIISVTVDGGGTVRNTNTSSTVLYRVNTHLGSAAQAADADAVNEIPEWTVDHKLSGIAYVYVRIRYERESFPTGVPNITALVEGKQDIYDPRDGGSYGYTNNAALCAADYLHSGMFGFGAEYGADIDTTALIAAANACDESITLTDASTEPRYTCNGIIDTSQTPKENLANLLTSMVGSCVFVGGQWKFYAGVYRTPQMSFDEDDLRAGLTIQTKRSRSNICNGVKGTYIYANDDESSYQPADFPSVTNALYKSEDGDVDIWKDLALAYTTSASMAQRIAKIELEKARQGITFKFPAKLTALNTTTGDVVNISNVRLGWTNKPFEIVDWEFAIADSGELGIDLTLQETASGIYDWANGEETTTDLAKNTNLPNPGYVAPVTALVIDENAVINAAGDEVINVKASWTESVSKQVDHYEVEGALSTAETDADWVRWTTSGTHYQVDGVASGLAYLVRVRAVSVYGSKSQWETVGFYADGINEIPVAPSDLALSATTDTLTATWTNNTAAEWMRGTNIYASTVNDRADASFGLVTLVGGDATRFSHSVPGGTTYYIWIATVAKNGQTSDFYPASATGGISGAALEGGGLTQQQQDDLDAASALIDGIAADGVVDRSEKIQWQGAWNNYVAEATNIKEQAVTFGYADAAHKDENNAANSTTYNNWIDAGNALYTYMTTTIDFEDTTTDCDLVAAGTTRSAFTANWDDYLEKRQLLLNAIEVSASQTATWSNVKNSDSNAPEDNATHNTGDLADKDTIDSSSLIAANAVTLTHLDTTIVDASNHIIADRLTANNIKAGTFTGLRFETGSSNPKIEIIEGSDGVKPDTILGYDSGGTIRLEIDTNGGIDCTNIDCSDIDCTGDVSSATGHISGALTVGTISVTNFSMPNTLYAGGLNLGENGDIFCDNIDCDSIDAHGTLDMNGYSIAAAGGISGSSLNLASGGITCGAINSYGNLDLNNYNITAGGSITGVSLDVSGEVEGGSSSHSGYGGSFMSSGSHDAVHAQSYGSASSVAGYGGYHTFYAGAPDGGYNYYAQGSSNYSGFGPFTGGHDGVMPDADIPDIGDIIVDVSLLNLASVSDAICLNAASTSIKQKAVFGVFVASKKMPQELSDSLNAATTFDEFYEALHSSIYLPTGLKERFYAPLDDSNFEQERDLLVGMLQTHSVIVVNAVGEGAINVCSEGGNIEAGDYICSSNTPGKGMKQDDDLMHSYTVAKAREDVVWTDEEISSNIIKMIACTYHCG